ncbi:winged helix-turn-helix transcriptional regulator [Streptomyces sp. NPDC002668]|uniref:winged helix-turn-helix transcriptional regulator n=1 Tax=Streptomyces sp. NPDC002668 TaxID=3154422 RepID=UPI00331DB19D
MIGEKYALLVLREVLFGVRRFDGIVRNIGVPRDILATRLKSLVAAGVLQKVQYNERPPRYEYHFTTAGEELSTVLVRLKRWGDRHLVDTPPLVLEHSGGADLDPVVVCRNCGQEPDATNSMGTIFAILDGHSQAARPKADGM